MKTDAGGCGLQMWVSGIPHAEAQSQTDIPLSFCVLSRPQAQAISAGAALGMGLHAPVQQPPTEGQPSMERNTHLHTPHITSSHNAIPELCVPVPVPCILLHLACFQRVHPPPPAHHLQSNQSVLPKKHI